MMGHWARARAQPQKRAGGCSFWGWDQAPAPTVHDVGPMSYGLVLCPMPLSYVLWLCPMSYGPVLCLVALSHLMALSYVLYPVAHVQYCAIARGGRFPLHVQPLCSGRLHMQHMFKVVSIQAIATKPTKLSPKPDQGAPADCTDLLFGVETHKHI